MSQVSYGFFIFVISLARGTYSAYSSEPSQKFAQLKAQKMQEEWSNLPNPVTQSELSMGHPPARTKKRLSNRGYARIILTCLALPILVAGAILLLTFKHTVGIREGGLNVEFTNVSDLVVEKLAHDVKCYTQGLFFLNRTHLFQSCGGYSKKDVGPSFFRVLRFNQEKGDLRETYRSGPFGEDVFLEGSTLFPLNNMVYLLTWKEGRVYRLNSTTFEIIDTLPWKGQGWGITHNNTHLIISTGSSLLYVVDQNLTVLQTVRVRLGERRREQLNELEWVGQTQGQFVYANVYGSGIVLKVSLEERMGRGRVVGGLDCRELVREEAKRGAKQVLNGVAYHRESGELLLTGKRWNNFYLLQALKSQEEP